MREELLERLTRVRLEIGSLERIVRELGNKAHARIIADLFERCNELEAQLISPSVGLGEGG
jgi:hypothetical protein